MTEIKATPKHPDVHPGTPQEKAEDARNLVALRPRQTLYVKIRANCPIETDKSDAFLEAVEVFERACRQADVELSQRDVTVTPMEEAQEKRETERREKRETARREHAETRAKAEPR